MEKFEDTKKSFRNHLTYTVKDKVFKVDLKNSKLQNAVEHKISTYTGNNLRRVSMRVFVCREATEVSKLGSKSSKVEKCHRRSKDKLLKWKR